MVKGKKIENRREIISLSFPPELACHVRKHKNMSSYIRGLVIKDMEGVEQESIVEQIKTLLSSYNVLDNINIKLDTLSAIDSIIGEGE